MESFTYNTFSMNPRSSMLLCLGTYLIFLPLKQEMHRRFENAPDSAKTKALQTVIEMKVKETNSFYQME